MTLETTYSRPEANIQTYKYVAQNYAPVTFFDWLLIEAIENGNDSESFEEIQYSEIIEDCLSCNKETAIGFTQPQSEENPFFDRYGIPAPDNFSKWLEDNINESDYNYTFYEVDSIDRVKFYKYDFIDHCRYAILDYVLDKAQRDPERAALIAALRYAGRQFDYVTMEEVKAIEAIDLSEKDTWDKLRDEVDKIIFHKEEEENPEE